MKNRIVKSSILNACMEKQEKLINSFKQRESEINKDVFGRNESASQTEDRKGGKIELLKALGNELAFAQQEMVYLKSLNATKENTVVEPGAVVVTNQLVFFIGVSSEKLEINKEEVFGISTKAPIYESMQGLQKGNSFDFNETSYIIEEVY